MQSDKAFTQPVMRHLVLIALALLLAACSRGGDFQDLEQFVDEVKSRPGAPVEPVPEFEAYEAFTYGAASLRSPFDVPVVIQQGLAAAQSQNVKPDLDRVREPLESFALAELSMVGMMVREEKYIALVQDTAGLVHRVSVGNYLGRNHGRVTLISPTQLDLVEIVPSGDGGWVERPQFLALVQ